MGFGGWVVRASLKEDVFLFIFGSVLLLLLYFSSVMQLECQFAKHERTCWVDRRDLPRLSIRGTMADLFFCSGGVGWGWVGLGGVGWGWVGGAGIIPNLPFSTQHDPHLHLMLRYMMLTCA